MADPLRAQLAPPKQRQRLLGINAGVYMLGRGLGATLAPFFNNATAYGSVFTAVSLLAWICSWEIVRLEKLRAGGV